MVELFLTVTGQTERFEEGLKSDGRWYDHDEVRCMDTYNNVDVTENVNLISNNYIGRKKTCCVCINHDCEVARQERRKHPLFNFRKRW